MLAASLYFYMAWKPAYILLIIMTSLVAYFSALIMEKPQAAKYKKTVLIFALIINIGTLFLFKYFNFFNVTLSSVLGVKQLLPHFNLLLPIGISFYTFQTVSYFIDVYRGKFKAEKNYPYFLLYVTFFPQLVAGPIERADRLLPQLKNPKPFSYDSAAEGVRYMVLGMFKKIVIADNLAVCVDMVYGNLEGSNGLQLAIAAVIFTVQLYCDFAGYSDIAVGAARVFGVELMQNFHRPFFSKSMNEFWQRWHYSLAIWLRDYIYFPLGGSRCSAVRHLFNLLVVFFFSGLWHGASITYVLWGVLNGIIVVIEVLMRKPTDSAYKKLSLPRTLEKLIKIGYVYIIFVCTCIFVRADTLADVGYIYKTIWADKASYFNLAFVRESLAAMNLNTFNIVFYSLLIFSLFLIGLLSRKEPITRIVARQKTPIRWTIYILAVLVLFIFRYSGVANFIYFQF
ncbi:MAG: MBOAT family protein [Clostridia bacterium]|nr:MBOAT family protein [Clostridia bacterium]